MKRKPRVILFETDKSTRKMLEIIFKKKGFDIFSYEDTSLCPLLHSHDYQCSTEEVCADIVITDLKMPSVSGLDFIEEQMKKGCNISKVVIMSGSWSDKNRKRAKNLGCEVFFKPFSLSHFEEWIDKCLGDIAQSKRLSSWFLKGDDT